MSLRLNGSTSGYSEIDAPAIAGNNTLVLPTTNGSAHQLLKNSGTAGTLEYGVTLPSGNGLADQVLGGDGAGIISWVDRSRMVLETARSATGTEVDFTGIPSWVKRVTVMFAGVSTNGTSLLVVRLGTSGGVVSSGYNGAASSVGSTVVSQQWASGFGLRGATTAAANIYGGHMLLSLINGNDWVSSHSMSLSDTPVSLFGSGFVSLGGTLDQVRITTTGGANTFDAGTINLLLEG